MKRIISAFLLLCAGVAFGATTTPVQLLSPTGSTSGQVITSSGPSSAPTWANISLSALAPVAANTVISNFTGSSASPVAFSVPSCSTANSALKYTSGTGLSCGSTFALTSGNLSQFASTTSAQLLGVMSDETGSGSLVFGTSPTLTTPNIVGTATNDNAATGSVGQYAENTTSGTSLTSGVVANATSTSLTAGDWDVSCEATYSAAGGATPTLLQTSISTTSATGGGSGRQTLWTVSFGANSTNVMPTPRVRLSLSGTTTTYCTASASFGAGTMTVAGFIRARRVR